MSKIPGSAISVSIIFLTSIFLCSCSTTKWNTDNRQLRGEKIAIGLSSGFGLENRALYVTDVVADEFQHSVLDSLMKNTLSRYISGMSRAGLIDASYLEPDGEPDIRIVIDEMTISRSFSMDFVLRGPVLKTSLLIAAYRGTNRIFETKVSGSQNMAYVARDGRRFYWMSDEDRNNPAYQNKTLVDAVRSALGTAYRRFFDQ